MTADVLPEVEQGLKMTKKKKVDPDSVVALAHLTWGIPKNHFKTDVHHVFGDNWRINIWTSVDSDCIVIRKRITQSYFITISDNNGVLKADKVW
jgi:hypothetical protein